MAWTTPHTFAAREQMTPTLWNTAIRDNLDFLKALPLEQDYDTSQTTTQISFVTSTLTKTLTTYGGNVLFRMVGCFSSGAANTLNGFDFRSDAVSVMDGDVWNFTTPGTNVQTWCNVFFITETPPSAGSHTFAVYWKTAASTLTMHQARFFVTEQF